MFMLETLFLFSLGITFLLILLLIYHFKNRLSGLEQKHEVLLEILNTLVQETHMIKAVVGSLYHPPSSQVTSSPSYNVSSSVQEFSKEENDYNLEEVLLEEDEEEEEEEEQDEEEEEQEENEEEGSLSDLEQEVEHVSDPEPVLLLQKEDLTVDKINDNVEKMKLPELRALVTQRGLSSDASKLKKPQLLELLQTK